MVTIDIVERSTFKRKTVLHVSEYEVGMEADFSGVSYVVVSRGENVQKNDYAIIREHATVIFCGIVKAIENKDEEKAFKVTISEMNNLFEGNIVQSAVSLIEERGIEDFIKYSIQSCYVNSGDPMTDLSYVDVHAKTHTTSKILPDSDNDIFNLKNYLVTVQDNESIFLDYSFENDKLRINIEKKEPSNILLDTTITDVSDYKEVFTDSKLAKLIVIWKRSNVSYEQLRYYMLKNGEISEDVNDPLRIGGDEDTIFIDSADETAVYEQVSKKFRENAYEHSVEFDVSTSSKVIESTQLWVGRQVKCKTPANGVFDSIITKIQFQNELERISVKLGNLKTTLTEKIRGGNGNG